MQRLINQLTPFFLIGMLLVVFAFGVVLFAYLAMFGVVVGSALFFFNWIKSRLFPTTTIKTQPIKSGRVIDSNDWKEL